MIINKSLLEREEKYKLLDQELEASTKESILTSESVLQKVNESVEQNFTQPIVKKKKTRTLDENMVQRVLAKLDIAKNDSIDFTLEATNIYLKARLLVLEEEVDSHAKAIMNNVQTFLIRKMN